MSEGDEAGESECDEGSDAEVSVFESLEVLWVDDQDGG